MSRIGVLAQQTAAPAGAAVLPYVREHRRPRSQVFTAPATGPSRQLGAGHYNRRLAPTAWPSAIANRCWVWFFVAAA